MSINMVYIRSDDAELYFSFGYIMQMEGNKWVLRTLPDYITVDQDQYRNSLAKRHNIDLYSLEIEVY